MPSEKKRRPSGATIQLGNLGGRTVFNDVAVSRDGRRVVVSERDPHALYPSLWLIDSVRGVPTRFTFDEGQDYDSVWSPDNRWIAFASNRDSDRDGRVYNLYLKDSTGVRPEGRLQKAEVGEHPCDWSPDGRFLMYIRAISGSAKRWVISDPAGDPAKRKAAPYLDTPFHTAQGQFSPDGRWVAYNSNESKHGSEIYVQSFPAGAGKFQVSNSGGVMPRGRRDGKELFYIAGDGKLMAVNVKTAPKFEAEIPRALFDPHIQGGVGSLSVFRYDVAPDGQRFLVNRQLDGDAPEPITVVMNWQAELKK